MMKNKREKIINYHSHLNLLKTIKNTNSNNNQNIINTSRLNNIILSLEDEIINDIITYNKDDININYINSYKSYKKLFTDLKYDYFNNTNIYLYNINLLLILVIHSSYLNNKNKFNLKTLLNLSDIQYNSLLINYNINTFITDDIKQNIINYLEYNFIFPIDSLNNLPINSSLDYIDFINNDDNIFIINLIKYNTLTLFN